MFKVNLFLVLLYPEQFSFCWRTRRFQRNARNILVLYKDQTAWRAYIASQTYSMIDIKSKKNSGLLFALKLDIKPWGTPQDHGNLKVQFSTWKKGNYSQERKHIPFDFQHTSDGKNYYSCSVNGSRFLAESGFMYLIICGMREKLHLGPTWHAPLTVKHIISSVIIFFSLGFDWHPVSIQTIWGYFLPWKWSGERNSHSDWLHCGAQR